MADSEEFVKDGVGLFSGIIQQFDATQNSHSG
jgi:hypothetical protein